MRKKTFSRKNFFYTLFTLIYLSGIIIGTIKNHSTNPSSTTSRRTQDSSATITQPDKPVAKNNSETDSALPEDSATSDIPENSTTEHSDEIPSAVSDNDQQSNRAATDKNADISTSADADGGKTWIPAEYKTVTYPEEGHYENQLVSAAWSEQVQTGEKFICDCGAEFSTHSAWAAHKEANGG